jgi:hypothetical protein
MVSVSQQRSPNGQIGKETRSPAASAPSPTTRSRSRPAASLRSPALGGGTVGQGIGERSNPPTAHVPQPLHLVSSLVGDVSQLCKRSCRSGGLQGGVARRPAARPRWGPPQRPPDAHACPWADIRRRSAPSCSRSPRAVKGLHLLPYWSSIHRADTRSRPPLPDTVHPLAGGGLGVSQGSPPRDSPGPVPSHTDCTALHLVTGGVGKDPFRLSALWCPHPHQYPRHLDDGIERSKTGPPGNGQERDAATLMPSGNTIAVGILRIRLVKAEGWIQHCLRRAARGSAAGAGGGQAHLQIPVGPVKIRRTTGKPPTRRALAPTFQNGFVDNVKYTDPACARRTATHYQRRLNSTASSFRLMGSASSPPVSPPALSMLF